MYVLRHTKPCIRLVRIASIPDISRSQACKQLQSRRLSSDAILIDKTKLDSVSLLYDFETPATIYGELSVCLDESFSADNLSFKFAGPILQPVFRGLVSNGTS